MIIAEVCLPQFLPLSIAPTAGTTALDTRTALLANVGFGSRGVGAIGPASRRHERAKAAHPSVKCFIADKEGTVGWQAGSDDRAIRLDVCPNEFLSGG